MPKGAAKGAAGAVLVPGAMFLGYEAASKGDFKGLSEGAAIRKKILKDQMSARTAPMHSALVRQKGQAGQNLKPWLQQAKKVGSGAKANASQDLGKAKQAAAPLKQVAGEKAAAAKKVASADKKAAIKALTPARSALVRQKERAGLRLKPVKSTMAQDLKGIRKDMSGAKDAAKQSKAASDLKKAGASTNQGITKVSDRIGRWLAGGKQG